MCEDVKPQETLLFPLVEATAVAGSGDLAGNITESAPQKVSKDLRQVATSRGRCLQNHSKGKLG